MKKLIVATVAAVALAGCTAALAPPVAAIHRLVGSPNTKAWFVNFEIDDSTHTPIVDGSTVPVGTVLSYNVWAHIDPTDAANVAIIVQVVNGPGNERWNSRTPGDGPYST